MSKPLEILSHDAEEEREMAKSLAPNAFRRKNAAASDYDERCESDHELERERERERDRSPDTLLSPTAAAGITPAPEVLVDAAVTTASAEAHHLKHSSAAARSKSPHASNGGGARPSMSVEGGTETTALRRRLYRLRPVAQFVPASTPSAASSSTSPPPGYGSLGMSGVTPSMVYSNDSQLVRDDRKRVTSMSKSNVVTVALTIAGMLFPFALPVTGVAALYVFRRTLLRRRTLSKDHKKLMMCTCAASLLAAVLAFIDFSVAVWVAAKYPFRRCMYWWGAAMIPATYPIFILQVVLGAYTLVKAKQALREAAWQALSHASEQKQSVTRHYRIARRRVIAAMPVEADVSVYVNPDQRTREKLVMEVGIEESMLEDALDPVQEAHVEFRQGHMSAVIRIPEAHNDADAYTFRVSTLGLFLFANKLVIVLSDSRPLFEGRLFEKVESLPDLVVRLLRRITRNFEDNLKRINAASELLEADCEHAMNNKTLMNNFQVQKSLVYHANALASNSHVLSRMSERLDLAHRSAELLLEVIAENTQSQKMADIFLTVICGLVDSRASIISNNLNVMMKNLNCIVIAMSVGTFLSGVGGMSEFTSMIGGFEHWLIGYPVFIISSVLLSVFVFFVLNWTEPLWAGK